MTIDQKVHCAEQSVKDIISCVDKIATSYPESVVSYAKWYLEQPIPDMTYVELITRSACRFVARTGFMVPDVQWEVFEG